MKARLLLQSAGAAAVILFPVYGSAVSDPQWFRMHSDAPLTNFALALIFNIVLLTLVLFLSLLWLKGTRLGGILRLSLPGMLVAGVAEGIYILQRKAPSSFVLPLAIFLAVTALVLVARLVWQRGDHFVMQSCRAALAGCGIFSMIAVIQLGRMALWRPLPDPEETSFSNSAGQHPGRRVVWILFDELSYDQVFEHRFAKLDLPNFDRLRAISTVFSNVQPTIPSTEIAVPSILQGETFNRVHMTEDNRFLVGTLGQPLSRFEPSQTPFALAKDHGMTTGVVGWYNPYCSMLSPYVNQCYWAYEVLNPAAFIVGDGFWANVKDAWVRYWVVLDPRRDQRSLINRVRTYQSLMAYAKTALSQNGPDFVFLHLPLPHPPGFYNRETGRFDTSGTRSYIDNLALTDKALGQLLSILEQSPQWQQTSILVCGDHSWRTSSLWRPGRFWTAEDEAASQGGHYDPRPLLMVHVASQKAPATITQPFPLPAVHGILESLVLGQMPDYKGIAR